MTQGPDPRTPKGLRSYAFRLVSWLPAGLVAYAFLAGCGEETSTEKTTCDHLKDGADVALTAGLDPLNGPELKDDGRHQKLAFVDLGGGMGGFARLTLTNAGRYSIFLNEEVQLRLYTAGSDTEWFPVSMSRMGRCAEIRVRLTLALPAGTFTLAFQPTPKMSVGVVVARDEGR